jgi:uncharacterized membrane protein
VDLLDALFSLVCHQDPARTWWPGGVALPFCERCAGLYAGAALALVLLGALRPRATGRFLRVHGLLLLAMAPLGFHLVPHGPVLRTLSGCAFGFGLAAFLLVGAGALRGEAGISGRWAALLYTAGGAASAAAVLLLAMSGWAPASAILAVAGAAGLLALAVLAVAALARIVPSSLMILTG